MAQRTHASTLNWRSSGALGDLFEPHKEISVTLSKMNGKSIWGYSIWRIPEGQRWPDNDMSPNAFLQSAGTAERMTIELREISDDGTPRQYAIGRPGTAHGGQPSVPVQWAGAREVLVYPGEDFTAAQAAPVYISYYETGRVPAGYVLRELDLRAS